MSAPRLSLVRLALLITLPVTGLCARAESPPAYLLEAKIVAVPEDHPVLVLLTGGVARAQADRLDFERDLAGLDTLAAPRLIVLEGQLGEIKSRSTLQYFEPAPGGLYALETWPSATSPGFTLKGRITPGASGGLKLETELSIFVLTQRERLRGVQLDVGKPIMASNTMKTELAVNPGEWSWMVAGGNRVASTLGHDTPHRLIVLIRVAPTDTN